jgi:hypothetical protein
VPTRKRKQIKCVFVHVSFTFSRQNQDLHHFLRKKPNKKEIRRYSKRSSMKMWKDLKLGGLDKESRTIHLSYVAVERERYMQGKPYVANFGLMELMGMAAAT